MDDPFPLYVPPEARRLFQSESLLRRLAQAAHWSKSSRLLELHGSLGGLALSQALGCRLTVVEPDAKASESLKERARSAGLTDRTTFLTQAVAGSSFAVEGVDGILALGRVLGVPGPLAKRCRVWLAPKGRLAITVLVRVGRAPPTAAVEAWAKRLGSPLPTVREALLSAYNEGFEPEFVDTLGETELDDYYREVEAAAAKLPADSSEARIVADELRAFRSSGPRSGATFAVLALRRREPGEKPPVARDGG